MNIRDIHALFSLDDTAVECLAEQFPILLVFHQQVNGPVVNQDVRTDRNILNEGDSKR